MAYGARCAYCGFQEADHEGALSYLKPGETTHYEDPYKVTRGHRNFLHDCQGFVYQRRDEPAVVKNYSKEKNPTNLKFTIPEHLKERALRKWERDNPSGIISDRVILLTLYGAVDIGS